MTAPFFVTLGVILAGPLGGFRQRPLLSLLIIGLVVILTLASQVGGLILWLSYGLGRRIGVLHLGHSRWRMTTLIIFVVFYGLALVALPQVSGGLSGRVALACLPGGETRLVAHNLLPCLLFRNYLSPSAAQALEGIADRAYGQEPARDLLYLDAGFPFGALPMLPHLGHRSGLEIDLAFPYLARSDAQPSNQTPSPIGYFGVEPPRSSEANPCARAGLQHEPSHDLQLDRVAFTRLVRGLSQSGAVGLMFLEPHLVERYGLSDDKMHFAGCHAGRHDDHLHVTFASAP